MTPKEKAEELFKKYATYVVMWAGDTNTTHQNCKQCALIAVDEILDLIITIYDYDREQLDPYWKQVKQELEKL
jgi:hypothetical protein